LFNELVRELWDEPQPPAQPITPPPDAFDNNGELIDPEHIAARAAYEQAMERYAGERSKYEVAVAGGDARPLFKKLLQRSLMLASISPYFVADLNGDRCYGG
jgi:hypothetical protein